MKLHHGMTVIVWLDGEEMHLRLTANPAGPGEMQPGDNATFIAPVQDAAPIRVEFITTTEKAV